MTRKLSTILLLIILTLPIFAQLNNVKAESAPITSPVTSPETTPTVTLTATPTMSPTPATAPVTFFNVVGHITYRRVGLFFKTLSRIFPAGGVTVVIDTFLGHSKQHLTTQTNSNGDYMFTVPTGLYKITVRDSKHTFFIPPLRITGVKATKQKTVNFQGLLFR